MHSFKKEKKNILSFIKSEYPDLLCIILSGSTIDGTANVESDIDIVVIVKDRNQLCNETLELKSQKLQIFLIPIQHVHERLHLDYFYATCHFIGLLAKGIHLFGDEKLTDSLIKQCIEIKKTGPRPISAEDDVRLRIHITNRINKLANKKEKWENLVLDASELVNVLIGYKLHSEGMWKGEGKHRMKFLEEHNHLFKQQLISALEHAYLNKNYQHLIALSKEELKTKGGLVQIYPKGLIQLAINENFISIRINSSSDSSRLRKLVVVINDALAKLKEKTSVDFNHHFYSEYLTDESPFSKDIFCVVYSNNSWLNNFFIDWLYKLKEEHNFYEVTFPVFISPYFRFASKQLHEHVLPVFLKLGSFYLQNKKEVLNEGLQISLAIPILKNLDDLYFKNGYVSFKDFLFFLFKSSFIHSYDNRERITSIELIKRRENTFLQFERTFQLQKKILTELWNEETDSIILNELTYIIGGFNKLKSELDNLPDFSFYLLNSKEAKISKELVLLKEVIVKCMKTLLLDISDISYIFYICLRLSKVSLETIKS